MNDFINGSFESSDKGLIQESGSSKHIPRLPPLNHDVTDDVGTKPTRRKKVSFQEPPVKLESIITVSDVIHEDTIGDHVIGDVPTKISSTGDASEEISGIPEISDLWWNNVALHGGRKEKQPQNNFEKVQMAVRTFIDHLGVRIFGVFLIFLDIILMIIDLSLGEKTESSQLFFDGMALGLSSIFMVDLFLRIFSYGFREFFTSVWEVMDGVIIIVTFAVTILYTALDEYVEETDAQGLGRLIVFARLLRVVRVARIFYSHQQMKKSSRMTVSQNKRRYQKDGFDLDLTYVTDDVIAMSFPSSGVQSYFRNPIKEVRRFFETKHKGKYKIYNLCSERSYDVSMFENRVSRVMIDDHNVPTISDLMKFIDDARQWMASGDGHVIAIHCKGGKGRTGTIVCSWLIDSGMFQTAKDALEYFGLRRTDMNVGEAFQGVETASQIRYVGYFERIKKEFGGAAPVEKEMKLTKVVINSIAGVGRGNGSDLSMQVILQGKEVLMCKFAENYNCQASHNSKENNVTCCVIDCPTLRGDVKFRFTSSDTSLPRGYDDCAFYFWINTGFVDNCQATLSRDQLDNPHKKKTWHIFKEDFSIHVTFENTYNQ